MKQPTVTISLEIIPLYESLILFKIFDCIGTDKVKAIQVFRDI